MIIRRAITPALLLAASVGCNSTEPDLPRENYALIYAEARSTSSGYATLPVASFFRSLQLQVSSSVESPDQCIDAGYSPNGGEQLDDITFLNAGTSVTAARGAETRQLTKVVNAETDVERYEVTSGGALPFTPGDTLEFTVPGAQGGFPAFSIRARSAEAFTFEEPAVPAAGQPV